MPDHLFTVLPRGLLLRYLPDRPAARAGPCAPTARPRAQPALVRRRARPRRLAYLAASHANQYRKFARYYPVSAARSRAVPSRRPCRDAPDGPWPGRAAPWSGWSAGVGPLATAYFLERVVRLTDAATDQEHVDLVVHQRATSPTARRSCSAAAPTTPAP